MRWLPRGHPDRGRRTRLELSVAGGLLATAVFVVAVALLGEATVMGGWLLWLAAAAVVGGAVIIAVVVSGYRNRRQSFRRRVVYIVLAVVLAVYVAFAMLTGENPV